MKSRPIVVQHSSGERGAGGPVMNLQRVLNSHLNQKYDFVAMHQDVGVGGIDTKLITRWVRMLRSTKPDLVHIRGLQNEGFQAIVAARLASCPKILVSVHGTVRDLRFAQGSIRRSALVHLAEPATLRLATHVATVCRSAAERTFVRQHRNKFVGVIPNGVQIPDLDAARRRTMRTSLGVDPSATVLVTVSRLTWEKGFKTLHDAVDRFRSTAVPPVLLIVGDGPDRGDIENLFATVRTMDVRFLGRRLDVEDILSAADLFVFPSLHENLSNALLEAMAHALPVLASAVGGNIEVLAAGGGLLFPAEDSTALANGIDDLVAHPDRRRALGHAARKIVEDTYSQAAMFASLDNCYQKIMGSEAIRA